MSEKTYGYVRVSTKGQCEDRQIIAMRDCALPGFMDSKRQKNGIDLRITRRQSIRLRLAVVQAA